MSQPAAAPGGHERQFFLDWLRVGALALLIVFHVGMYYVDWPYHVKSPYASAALAPWMMLSEPWRMSLLFLISGAATAYMLQARSHDITVFLRRRSKQLLLPLLCGIFLVVPPQTYFEVRQKFNYSGDFWEFLRLYYAGAKAFCLGPDCLVMPTWNHLWFLPYLWLYSVLMALVHRFAPRLLAAGVSCLQQRLQSYALLLWPMLALALIRWGLHGRLPSTHDFIHDGFNHARYLTVFVLGFSFAQMANGWQRFAEIRHAALAVALLSWSAFILTFQQVHTNLTQMLLASLQWSAVCAAVGYAGVHLNVDSPWRARLSAAVFPVYIFHQTVLIVASQWLGIAALSPWTDALALIGITLLLSYAAYWLVDRVPVLRPWFGCQTVSQLRP